MAANNRKGYSKTLKNAKGQSGNPRGRPLGSKSKLYTKDGHAELVRKGFNPVLEMIKLYANVSNELEDKKYDSHVWHAAMRNAQRGILDSLLPYSVHKVEVTREKDIEALKQPPVIIQLPGAAADALERNIIEGSASPVAQKSKDDEGSDDEDQ